MFIRKKILKTHDNQLNLVQETLKTEFRSWAYIAWTNTTQSKSVKRPLRCQFCGFTIKIKYVCIMFLVMWPEFNTVLLAHVTQCYCYRKAKWYWQSRTVWPPWKYCCHEFGSYWRLEQTHLPLIVHFCRKTSNPLPHIFPWKWTKFMDEPLMVS